MVLRSLGESILAVLAALFGISLIFSAGLMIQTNELAGVLAFIFGAALLVFARKLSR